MIQSTQKAIKLTSGQIGVGGGGRIVHDSLHFAGLKDRYKEPGGWRANQKRKPAQPVKRYDNSNIMSSSGGTTLKPEQIKEAKDNKSTKSVLLKMELRNANDVSSINHDAGFLVADGAKKS